MAEPKDSDPGAYVRRVTQVLKALNLTSDLERAASAEPAKVVGVLLGREEPTELDYSFALHLATELGEEVENELYRKMGENLFGVMFRLARSGKDREGIKDIMGLTERVMGAVYEVGHGQYELNERARVKSSG